MSSYRVHPAAQRELETAAARYERERPGLGADFVDEYQHKLELALRFPQSGARWPGIDEYDVRSFVFRRFPFSLTVTTLAGVPTVIAVAHQHRRPAYWLRRLRG